MKRKTITVADLSRIGGISKSAIYKAVRVGTLPGRWPADPVKLLLEWRQKRDPAHEGRLGPALERVIRKLGLTVPVETKPRPLTAPAEGVDENGAPAHLTSEMRRFYKAVTSEFELEESGLLTLQLACESYDRAQEARRMIAAEGLVLRGRRHPAVDVESKAQAAFLRAWRALGLDIEEPGPVGRPPGR